MSSYYQPKIKRNNEENIKQIRVRVINLMKSIITKHPEIRNRKAFALSIFTGQASVSRWENGKGFPTLENVADICQIYNVSPSFILLGQGNAWGDAEIIVRLEMAEKKIETIEKYLNIETKKSNKKSK